MKIDITQIVVALIGLLSAILTGFLVPWIKSKIGVNNDKITDNQRMLLKLAIETAVTAAEQIYKSDEGQKKKAYVIGLLENQGFTVDSAALDAAVEAAVYRIKREYHPELLKEAPKEASHE